MAGEKLREGIAAFKAGNKSAARQILAAVVRAEPSDETAWLWLSTCVDTVEQKRSCLSRALAINPNNQNARKALAQLEQPPQPSFEEIASAPPVPTTPQLETSAKPPITSTDTPAPVLQKTTPVNGSPPKQTTPSAQQPVQTRPRTKLTPKKPWYRQSIVLLLTFTFLTPVWVALILTDKQQKTSVKVLASVALVFYLGYCCCYLPVSIRPQLGLWTPSGTVIPIDIGDTTTPQTFVEQERGIPISFSQPLEQFTNSGQVQSYPPDEADYLQGVDSILLETHSIMQKVDDLVSRDKAGGMSIEQFNEERIDLQVAFITGPAQDVQSLVPPTELRSMHKELIATLGDFQTSIAFLTAQDVPTLEEQGYVVIVGAVDSASHFQQGLSKLTSVWAMREDYLAGRTTPTAVPSDREESVQATLESLRIKEEGLPPDTYVLRPGEFIDNLAAAEQSEKDNGEQAIAAKFEQLQRWGRILGYNEGFAVPSSTPGQFYVVQDVVSLYQTEDGVRESFADALNEGFLGFDTIDSTNYPQLGDERLLFVQSSEEVESIVIRFRRSNFFVSVVVSASPQDLSLEQVITWAQLIDQRIQSLDPVQLNNALER